MRLLTAGLTAALLALPAAASAQERTGGWGVVGEKPGQFQEIQAVATDAKGYVYVADSFANTDGRIQKFRPDGKLVRQWGRSPDEDERGDNDQVQTLIAEPRGLTVGPDGNLYLSENASDRTRISVWTPTGGFVRGFATQGSGTGQLSNPDGLDFDAAGRLVVADRGNRRLSVFDRSGAAVGFVGAGESFSDGDDRLSSPTDVTLGPDGLLYVVDGPTIKRYGTEGAFAGLLGTPGTEPGPFFGSIGGLAFAGAALYLPDRGLSRVQAFEGGAFRPVGSTPGSQAGQFNAPDGVATDCKGSIYVADTGNFRIQRFGPAGAGACTDLGKDTQETFKTVLTGATQDFREDFAVRPAISCNRPCAVTLTGTVKLPGRRALKLDVKRTSIEYPRESTVPVVASERGTDTIISALRRNRRVTASIRFRAVDGTGRVSTRTRTYRLR